MRFAAAITATGLLSFLLLEIAKLFIAPLIAWALGVLAIALKVLLLALAVGAAIGVGVYFYRRSKNASAEI